MSFSYMYGRLIAGNYADMPICRNHVTRNYVQSGESIMKVTCSYSGLALQISHFPAVLSPSIPFVHPIFYIPQKSLHQYVRKWGNGELTDTDSYLLVLAYFNSTELCEFRVPAMYQEHVTPSLIARNLERTVQIVTKVSCIKHPSFQIPRIAITPETRTLENLPHWIADWESCYESFLQGNKEQEQAVRMLAREDMLARFIRDPNKPVAHYAKILADWAAVAGDFPEHRITHPTLGKPHTITRSDYWKDIITKCCKTESIFSIPKTDLEALITHCEEYIEHGTIHAHSLMELLRAGLKRQNSYLGLGDLDYGNTTFSLLSDDVSVEEANRKVLIDSAPKTKPLLGEYPTRFAYLRAKLAYEMAEREKERNLERELRKAAQELELSRRNELTERNESEVSDNTFSYIQTSESITGDL